MIKNPFTNHLIRINGSTYLRIKRDLQTYYPDLCDLYREPKKNKYSNRTLSRTMKGGKKGSSFGSVKNKLSTKLSGFKQKMKARNQPESRTDVPITPEVIPKLTKTEISKMMDRTGMSPAPETHSWYHHHAPFAQTFGDYVCIKKDNLNDIANFLKLMFAN